MKAMMALIAALVTGTLVAQPARADGKNRQTPAKGTAAETVIEAEAKEAEQSALDMQRQLYEVSGAWQTKSSRREDASGTSQSSGKRRVAGVPHEVAFANLVGSKILVVQTPGPGGQLSLQPRKEQ